MNNKEQSAGTIAGQSTEAEVTNISHNNGNTPVVCSQSLSAKEVVYGYEYIVPNVGAIIINRDRWFVPIDDPKSDGVARKWVRGDLEVPNGLVFLLID